MPAGLGRKRRARITQGFGPSAISRENGQRRVEIQAPLAGRPLGPVLTDAAAVMRAYPFPFIAYMFGETLNVMTLGGLAASRTAWWGSGS